ncbi:MAG: CPBP family intramembrane metalloprotease [Holophagales bacterium]|jgi:membrane protease YdiL (CAAX protease family)|nr:CPBP family intramembrane metalloprotease [Holophagales bacterium]
MSAFSKLLTLLENKQGQVKNGVKIIGFIFLLCITSILASFIPSPEPIKIWILIAVALVASWFCLKLEGQALTSIGLKLNVRFLLEFLAGALSGVLLIVISALIVKLFGGFIWTRNSQVNLSALFYALSPFFAISLFEELLFRGYAFQRAVRGLGKTNALLVFGLLFVVVHWSNPGMTGSVKAWASLNIGLASVLLGLAWLRTNSLALPIGIHLGWNWAQGSLLGFGVSGTKPSGFWAPVFNDAPQWLTGGEFGLEASLPASIVCLMACVCLGLWRRATTVSNP